MRAKEACGELWWCNYAMSKNLANKRFRSNAAVWGSQGVAAVAIEPGTAGKGVASPMNHGKGEITPRESAEGIKRLCDGLRLDVHGGKMFDFRGRRVPW